jgi:biotin synthase-related radical SAM superfamily protein
MKMKIIKEFKKKDEISMAAENIKVLNEEEPPTKTTSWIRYFFTNSKEDCKFNCKLCKKKISSTSTSHLHSHVRLIHRKNYEEIKKKVDEGQDAKKVCLSFLENYKK